MMDRIARMMAMDAAQQGGGTVDAYTKSETDALLGDKADIVDGKVPSSQLPSYVDDVVEYSSVSAFPVTGESGKIYIATDTNKTYRWGGSAYVEISESLALGETASTAYAGDKGKANADAIAKKPGEITTGKQYVIDGKTVTAGTGAEAFNNLTNNKASGQYSHAEGGGTTASGNNSHAEGQGTTALGPYSHSEGGSTTASGGGSHAEGNGTTASGGGSHAEGGGTTASGDGSHAEGTGTKASGPQSHAEGGGTRASGDGSHAEGTGTRASGPQSHAEGGSTTASGDGSHAEGTGTRASSASQHVQGKYNVADANGTYAFIIGNGTADNARHNAFAIDWNGLIYVNGASTGVDVSVLAPQSTTYTKSEVDSALAAIKDGTTIDSFADVETALSEKLNTSDVDTALSSTSANPVQNKAVYEEVKKKASLEDILGVGATIANNANMNSLTDIGKWYCANGTTAATVTNAPFNDAAYFGWTIRSVASSDRYVQIAIKNSDTFEIAKRRYSGTWSAWSYLASTAVT